MMQQEYDWCFLKNIMNEYFNNLFFIDDISVCKTHIIVSLAHYGWIIDIKK